MAKDKILETEFPLISMSKIDDLARKIAVAWHENATDWIGDKHKLASDIMNYHRLKSTEHTQQINDLREALEEIMVTTTGAAGSINKMENIKRIVKIERVAQAALSKQYGLSQIAPKTILKPK